MKWVPMLSLMWIALPMAALAHPGHPALMPQHAHAWFGIDPVYAIILGVAAAGSILLAVRYRRVRSNVK